LNDDRLENEETTSLGQEQRDPETRNKTREAVKNEHRSEIRGGSLRDRGGEGEDTVVGKKTKFSVWGKRGNF